MNGNIEFLLPSPIQKIEDALIAEKKLTLYIKRDDLIHEHISGNKWRKLKYNLENLKADRILTFGGAFSNHIAACAAICHDLNIKSIGLIRGEESENLNATLSLAKDLGMQIEYLSRKEYRKKEDPEFLKSLKKKYGNPLIIPEGGANIQGLKGSAEMLDEIDIDFDIILSAVGTGATIAGMSMALKEDQSAIGIVVLKGAEYLENEISGLLKSTLSEESAAKSMKRITLDHQYHFNGYAKINDELVAFMRSFYDRHAIKTDPVYSGKSLFALYDMIQKDKFSPGSTIIYYHCGGLQGIKGMEERYKFKLY